MSLWLDFMGAEVRYIQTPTYGKVRVAEAGDPANPPLLFLHGIGGHLEAYCKNLVALSDEFHVIAYDYVGHGMSEKLEIEYTPLVLVDHLKEVMDVFGIQKAHLSGESLGGWVSGIFATEYPERVDRLMLNTAAGLPILTEKGKQDLADLARLSKEAAKQGMNYEAIQNRMKWLFHPNNYDMITDELIRTRLAHYTHPDMAKSAPRVNAMMAVHDDYLTPLEKIQCETLFLWTEDNPVHDVETARICSTKVPNAQMYVMKQDSCHWPQYEHPQEFNDVARMFFKSGKIPT